MKTSINDGEQKELGPLRPSQLFLLRVWIEPKQASPTPEELAGKVQDPVSGRVEYFSGGMELVRILLRLIAKEVDRPHKHTDARQC